MSPRDLSSSTIGVRLRLIRDLLDDLEQFDDVTVDKLTSDRLRMLALERILTLLVDLAAAINQHIITSQTDSAPADYRASFDSVARLGVLPTALADAIPERWATQRARASIRRHRPGNRRRLSAASPRPVRPLYPRSRLLAILPQVSTRHP